MEESGISKIQRSADIYCGETTKVINSYFKKYNILGNPIFSRTISSPDQRTIAFVLGCHDTQIKKHFEMFDYYMPEHIDTYVDNDILVFAWKIGINIIEQGRVDITPKLSFRRGVEEEFLQNNQELINIYRKDKTYINLSLNSTVKARVFHIKNEIEYNSRKLIQIANVFDSYKN